MKAQNENYSEENQSKKHGMEMLFDGGRNRCARRACNHLRGNHVGKLCVCGHYGADSRRNVYAYAGRYFLFVYLGKHKIPVCEKGLYRKRMLSYGGLLKQKHIL